MLISTAKDMFGNEVDFTSDDVVCAYVFRDPDTGRRKTGIELCDGRILFDTGVTTYNLLCKYSITETKSGDDQ